MNPRVITGLPQSTSPRYARSAQLAADVMIADGDGAAYAAKRGAAMALRAFTIACELAKLAMGTRPAPATDFDAWVIGKCAELRADGAHAAAAALAVWCGYYNDDEPSVAVYPEPAWLKGHTAGDIPALDELEPPVANRLAHTVPEFVSDDGADPDAPIPYAPTRETNQGAKHAACAEMADRVRNIIIIDGYETMDGRAADVSELLRGIRHFCHRNSIRFEDCLEESCRLFTADRG